MIICLLFFSWTANSDAGQQEIDSYIRYIPSCSVDALPGRVEIIQSESEYSYELNPVRNTEPMNEENKISNGVKAFDKLPVKFSLDTQYIGIEDTVEVEFPSHLIGLATDIETTLPFFNFKHTYLRLGISPGFYSDDTSFEASNFRIPTRYFLIYQPNSKWTFLGGIAVYPDFENEVLPILGFIYKPNDRLTFNIIPKRPNISYQLFDKVTLFAEGGTLFNKEFEVTRGDNKNVVLRYQESRLAGGIKFKFNRSVQSSLAIGGVFNRTLKYRDNQGKVNIKDGLYTEFRLELGW